MQNIHENAVVLNIFQEVEGAGSTPTLP